VAVVVACWSWVSAVALSAQAAAEVPPAGGLGTDCEEARDNRIANANSSSSLKWKLGSLAVGVTAVSSHALPRRLLPAAVVAGVTDAAVTGVPEAEADTKAVAAPPCGLSPPRAASRLAWVWRVRLPVLCLPSAGLTEVTVPCAEVTLVRIGLALVQAVVSASIALPSTPNPVGADSLLGD